MDTVKLPSAVVNQILAQAQQSPKEEVCGLIGGKDQQYTHCYPVANVAKNKRLSFEMDPKGQIDAMRKIRESGEELLAIYHSHPNSPTEPSTTDIEQHEYPNALYLIVSLHTQGVLEIQGFRIRNKKVNRVAVRI